MQTVTLANNMMRLKFVTNADSDIYGKLIINPSEALVSWLDANDVIDYNIAAIYSSAGTVVNYAIEFVYDADAVAFKLCWGSS